MKKLKLLSYLLVGSLFISSCEDEIDIDLDEGTPQLVVDAFLTDIPGQQKIYLNKTTPYFDNTSYSSVSGADVRINDDQGNTYVFQDNGNGVYIWGDTTDVLAVVGNNYTLSIISEGQEYEANSTVNPVPDVDSISYEFREAEPVFGLDEGYFAWFNSTDIAGREDYYWIRMWRNDSLITEPSRILLSQDGAFSGSGADGFYFILPIREAINDFVRPYEIGEKVKVELRSINNKTFDYLFEIQTQMNNADAGLFATTPENVNTNINNVDPNSGVKAVGWFVISAASSAETTIQ